MSCSGGDSLLNIQSNVDSILKTEIKHEPQEHKEKIKTEYSKVECEFSQKQDLFDNRPVKPLNFEILLLKREQELVEDDRGSCNEITGVQNSETSDMAYSDVDTNGSDLPKFHKIRTTPEIIENGEQKCYSCKKCGEMFYEKDNWESHFNANHLIYSCPVCKQSYSKKVMLNKHMLIHSEYKPYACTVCCQSFRQKGSLKRHMFIHSGFKPFSCIHCNKSFIQKTCFENHMLMHTGLKPYSCTECGKSFTLQKVLKAHLSTHSNPYYYCNQCHRKFNHKSEYVEHKNNNLGCRPFLCDICHKSFSYKCNLRAHVLGMHTPDRKRHICPECGKAYTRKTGLKSHLCTHNGN